MKCCNENHQHTFKCLTEGYLDDDNTPYRLDEMYYKDFMKEINPNNLPHRDYAPLIKYVRYVATKKDTMKYFVPNHLNGWNTFIQFTEWDEQVKDLSITPQEAARLLLWGGNLKLHCQCPAYKFWGSQYILSQLDSAIVPEARFPHMRNPNLKGVVCKHLNRTLKVLPFHLGDMATQIKKQRLTLK
jgi:hypothetical protein